MNIISIIFLLIIIPLSASADITINFFVRRISIEDLKNVYLISIIVNWFKILPDIVPN